MNQFLKDEEIIEIVKDYVSEKNTDYAIMIDGDWGSGKTFFITNKMEDYLKRNLSKYNKKIKNIYISTYGVKSCSELDNKIHDQIIVEFLPKRLKDKFANIENTADALYKIIKSIKKLPDLPIMSIRNIIDILVRKGEKNYVMIFDDIERCDMPINTLLGYINEFVEHRQMKVILIANEKEIEKKKIYTDLELKYLAAINNNLYIPSKKEEKIDFFSSELKKNNNEKIDVEKLNERVKKLFGEDKLYKQVKEKLVGVTIYYKPDLESVFIELVNKQINDKKIKEYIIENKENILRVMNDKNHTNIRTLKFAISLIKKVFKIIFTWDLSLYEKNYVEECKHNILFYIVFACINYKEGLKKYVWSDMSEYGYIDSEEIANGYIMGFKFIDDIIEEGYIDKKRIRDVFDSYIKEKTENCEDSNDYLKVLQFYWELNDDIIIQNMDGIIEKTKRDGYSYNLYPKLLLTVLRIVDIGFDEKYLKEIKECIINNIEKTEKSVILNDYNLIFKDEKEKELYEKEVCPIKELIASKNKLKQEFNINSIITGTEGWGEKFCDYCEKHKDDFIMKKEFFKLIDADNLIKTIKNSNTKDVSDFRRRLSSMYAYANIKDMYKDDKENLMMFLKGLKSISNKELKLYDKSKKYNINLLKDRLEEIIKEYDK